jgi:5-hydroxyisourate hydrolase-like protein (transthyretin family)
MDLFSIMNKHEAASLFNQTLDANHPLYNEVKSEFTTLGMMDLEFKIGNKYQTTDEIAKEFRKMIKIKFKINTEPNTYNLIESFRKQFEKEIQGLEGQSLTKVTEPPS